MSRMNGIRQMIVDVLSKEERLRMLFPKYENRPDGVFLKLLPVDEFIPNEFIEENRAVLDPVLELPLARNEVRAAVFEVLKKLSWGAKLVALIDAFDVSLADEEVMPCPDSRWLVLSDEESRRLRNAYFGPDRKAAYAALQTPGELHWAVLNFDWRNGEDCFSSIIMNPNLDLGTAQYWYFNAREACGSRSIQGFDRPLAEGKFRSELIQFIPYWEPDHYFSREKYRPNQRHEGQYDAVYRPRTSDSPSDSIQAMRLCIREALAIHPVPPLAIEDQNGICFQPFASHGAYLCESFEFRVEDEFLTDHRDAVHRVMNAQTQADGPERMLSELSELFRDHPASEFLGLRDRIWDRSDTSAERIIFSPIEVARTDRCEGSNDRLAAHRALRTKAELHEVATHFYFQDPAELLYPIIRNPNLDRGTALTIFWNRYIYDYLPEPGEDAGDDEYVDLAKELYRNLLIGYYTTEEFSFDMENGLTERPDIPDSLKQPISGKYTGSSLR